MKVADQIHDFVLRLHPAQRRAIKAALRTLAAGAPGDTQELTDQLEGFYRRRVGKFRIIYRHLPGGEISCEFIHARQTVYEQFISLQRMIEER